MTGAFMICRRCHRLVTIVHPEPGHQFGWCNDCLIVYRTVDPDPLLPGLNRPVNDTKSRSRSKKRKTREPKES